MNVNGEMMCTSETVWTRPVRFRRRNPAGGFSARKCGGADASPLASDIQGKQTRVDTQQRKKLSETFTHGRTFLINPLLHQTRCA